MKCELVSVCDDDRTVGAGALSTSFGDAFGDASDCAFAHFDALADDRGGGVFGVFTIAGDDAGDDAAAEQDGQGDNRETTHRVPHNEQM